MNCLYWDATPSVGKPGSPESTKPAGRPPVPGAVARANWGVPLSAAYSEGLTVDEALSDQTGWPFPVENLRLAVTRSFDSLEVGE